MAFMNYEIGGNEVRVDASEAFADIPDNRTLIVEKLTDDDPVTPEVVEDLNTIEDVFRHFKPQVDVDFENDEGQTVNETFRFRNVGDFAVDKMTEQSEFLNMLNVEGKTYESIIKQLRSNKVLQRALENPDAKQAFITALQQLAQELENNQ
jgi:hypothetical protein